MKRLIFTLFSLALILFNTQNCSSPRDFYTTPQKQSLQFFRIKFNFKTDQGIQRGKILLKTDTNQNSTLTFLTPLNQILFQLYVKDQLTVLTCRRRGKYWEGPFEEIITTMWGLDLKFTDIVSLINQNKIPDIDLLRQKIKIYIKKGFFPKEFVISTPHIQLVLKVVKKHLPKSRLTTQNLNGLRKSNLNNILEKN